MQNRRIIHAKAVSSALTVPSWMPASRAAPAAATSSCSLPGASGKRAYADEPASSEVATLLVAQLRAKAVGAGCGEPERRWALEQPDPPLDAVGCAAAGSSSAAKMLLRGGRLVWRRSGTGRWWARRSLRGLVPPGRPASSQALRLAAWPRRVWDPAARAGPWRGRPQEEGAPARRRPAHAWPPHAALTPHAPPIGAPAMATQP
jgi:hypothetical protein